MQESNPTGIIRGKFAAWADHVASLGFADFLTAEDGFASEIRSGGPWLRARDSGIYTWITEGGEAYVGQTVNARSRLKQHWKNYRDIVYVAFKPVLLDRLDEEEPRMIAAIEARFPVLNISFAKSSASFVPFDRVVAPDQARRFLDGHCLDAANDWRDWPLLHRKQSRRFAAFERDELYRQSLDALRIYVDRCIPMPAQTEVRFWSVTVLNDSPVVFRVNAGQQEVFTLWLEEDELHARIVAYEPLSDEHGGPHYVSKSFISMTNLLGFGDWLTNERIQACRKLVVWLMRHTTPLNSKSHCPQLVRAAFGASTNLTSPY